MQGDYGRVYADLYRRHWWWRSRERILMRELRRLSPALPSNSQILDVGCGDALFFPKLREFGAVQGIEIDTSLLTESNPDRALIHTRPLGDAEYKGWEGRFDLITSLDVVEHIERDAWAVGEMVRMLRPGGRLMMTVPAFMSLWDHHDEINHHHRRYTASGFASLIQPPARLVSVRYLFHSLYVPKWLVARRNRSAANKSEQFSVPPRPVNALAAAWCDVEERLTRPLHIPWGTSVLAVAVRA